MTLNVLSESEQGLLGLAFHPDFLKNGKFYLNYVLKVNGKDTSRISEWIASSPKELDKSKITSERIIMEVAQPYSNHNAGQLAFGPDHYLYVAWGDGGWKDDPKKTDKILKLYWEVCSVSMLIPRKMEKVIKFRKTILL
ncbi:glucose/sorbosone dehydrogenase domain protein [Leptospira kirschneri str. 200801925]|nr:glucose/sorbosone dehydrogenase domain protein [Leptospira kirschneri str. 200801925]